MWSRPFGALAAIRTALPPNLRTPMLLAMLAIGICVGCGSPAKGVTFHDSSTARVEMALKVQIPSSATDIAVADLGDMVDSLIPNDEWLAYVTGYYRGGPHELGPRFTDDNALPPACHAALRAGIRLQAWEAEHEIPYLDTETAALRTVYVVPDLPTGAGVPAVGAQAAAGELTGRAVDGPPAISASTRLLRRC